MQQLLQAKKIIYNSRKKRSNPIVDHKQVTSWNAMCVVAYTEMYITTEKKEALAQALATANFIKKNLFINENQLLRIISDKNKLKMGFLEDYAWVINAWIKLYEVTFDTSWLLNSKALLAYALSVFYNEKKNIFSFTSKTENDLIFAPNDFYDQAIPSSSSMMSHNLFYLAKAFSNATWEKIMMSMLNNTKKRVLETPIYFTNWAKLHLLHAYNIPILTIIGPGAVSLNINLKKKISKPLFIFGARRPSPTLPILNNKPMINNQTTFYLCNETLCFPPSNDLSEILSIMNR